MTENTTTPDAKVNEWIAANVQRLRESNSWSQSELARRMIAAGMDGYNQMTVSRTEKGERSPSAGEVSVLADVLGSSIMMMVDSPAAVHLNERISKIEQIAYEQIKRGLIELFREQEMLATNADLLLQSEGEVKQAGAIRSVLSITPAELVESARAERLADDQRDLSLEYRFVDEDSTYQPPPGVTVFEPGPFSEQFEKDQENGLG